MLNPFASRDLLLVGSLPLETAQEVMASCAHRLGNWLPCIPDGEVGDRKIWIISLGYRVYHGHPEIETVNRPALIDGAENWKPKDLVDIWQFKVKPGIETVRFGDRGWRLGYARDAIGSYFVFNTLREKGVIAPDVRFQVCLPLTISAFGSMFRDPDDWRRLTPGIEEALRAEIEKMVEKIPPADLAIQWDCAVEVGVLEGVMPWAPQQDIFEMMVSPAERLSAGIPGEVMLGYHLCYGNLTDWPMWRPRDLSACVRYSNALVERSRRRVDFLHIPILDHADDSYYAPLRNLAPRDARVYLGVIHHMDDEADYRHRLSQCAKYVQGFGIAGPCGYGRLSASRAPGLLEEHRRGMEIWRKG